MKIFDQVEPWPTKVNFVDENNVGVGYDMEQNCCESAHWRLSRSPNIQDKMFCFQDDETSHCDEDLSSYRFDVTYFEEGEYFEGSDMGWFATFRLYSTDPSLPDIYLHLSNCHNGYYAHGFTMTQDGKILNSGSL